MKQKFAYVGRFSESGSRNSFYRMNNSKYGFKSFPNKELAEFAHAVQSELSRVDLAPKVYSPVAKIRIPEYFIKHNPKTGNIKSVKKMVLSDWGYLTEIAKPYICNDPGCGNDCAWEACCHNYSKIRQLVKDIEGMGIGYNDYHSGNLGYIIRNKKRVLVVIDLGRESVYDADSRYPQIDLYNEYEEDEYEGCSCSGCVAARNQEEQYA